MTNERARVMVADDEMVMRLFAKNMCLLYIIAGLGIVLTIISGQYSDHTALFWSFLGCTGATGFFYSLQRRIMADPAGQGRNTHMIVELGTGVFGFATLGLFLWLVVVIWL